MQKDAPHLYMDILRKALQHSAQMIALAHELQAKSQQAAETASANHRREIQRLQSEVHGIKRSGSSGSGDDESGGAAVTSPVRLAKQPSVGAQEWKRLNQRLGPSVFLFFLFIPPRCFCCKNALKMARVYTASRDFCFFFLWVNARSLSLRFCFACW